MKKALVVVVILAALVWVATWFRNPRAVATSAAQTWPAGLGTLDSVAARYPAMQANPASAKLTSLARTLPQNEAVADFVGREIARGELTIGDAPATLPDTSAIRDLLLHDPIVWPRPAGVGEIGDQETSARRGVQMTVARALIANALSKARANDPSAWEDLHAVWNLARSLEPQPQMMSQTAAFNMTRMVNAVAWKMPLPTPAWLEDLQQSDPLRPLLAAFQYQAASYWESGTEMFPTKWLADSVEKDRHIAETLAKETRCDITTPMNDLGTDLSSIWHRAFRYRAERELTANALRLRTSAPITSTSQCTDGTWTYDGKTLRFTREIPTGTGEKAMPLGVKI